MAALPLIACAATASGAGVTHLDGAALGAQIDPFSTPARCAALRADGSDTTVVFLSRGLLERDDGTLDVKGVDSRVGPALACGLEVGVRVSTKTSEDSAGALPADLDHFTDLLTQLAAHLLGSVDRYAIENEVNAPSHWSGNADEYFALVRAASAAIHAGDPGAEVLDSTLASGGLYTVGAHQLYVQGRREEALALVQEMQANELGGGPPVTDQADLDDFMASPQVARVLSFFDGAVANQSSYDAFQVHHYGPAAALPPLLDQIRSLGLHEPIEVWETNRRYLDGRPFVDAEHADDVAQLMLTAVGEGSAWTVFSSYLGTQANAAYGLVDFSGGSALGASRSFGTVSEELTGATGAERLNRVPKGVTAYRYERPRGPVVALWGDDGMRPGDSLDLDATTAAVTVAGGGRTRDVVIKRIAADPTPRFAEPDLAVLSQVGAASPRRIHLRIECPRTSPFGRCAGEVEVTGRGRLGQARYDVRRGRSAKLTVRYEERGRARLVTAVTRRNPAGGRTAAKSWLRIR